MATIAATRMYTFPTTPMSLEAPEAAPRSSVLPTNLGGSTAHNDKDRDKRQCLRPMERLHSRSFWRVSSADTRPDEKRHAGRRVPGSAEKHLG